MRGRAIIGMLGLAAMALRAQSIEIFSEFQRPDPFGEVVKMDRSESRREILSPAVVRNGHASFHVVVTAPAHTNYLLYVGLDPMDACRLDLYREHFVKTAKGWVPDTLTPLRQLPDFGTMPDPSDGIPGQTARVYLLDLWVPRDAPPLRFRVEMQLKVGTFQVAPMEVRILPARAPAPALSKTVEDLPAVEAGADAAAIGPLKRYLAGQAQVAPAEPLTVRAIIRRNAAQDMALMGAMEGKGVGPEDLRARWFGLAWSLLPRTLGAEWYLKLRDWIYRESQEVPW